MADERLVAALDAWLRDSDVPPPDTPMSATRVVAGIEATAQLSRWWPPARLAAQAKPAPALGAFGPAGPPPRPVPRVQRPGVQQKVREVLTPARVLLVAVVASLIGGTVFISASLMPGAESPAAVLAPVASPSAGPLPTPAVTPVPTPEPTPTPFPTWPPSDRALDWTSAGVRLEADALRLRIRGKLFAAPGEVLTTGTTAVDHALLESTWYEGDVEQRMVVALELDDSYWWIREIKTYDGNRSGKWIDFSDLAAQTRTLLGQRLEGDLLLHSTGAQRKALRKVGSAKLRFDGLRLSAFGSGSRPAPLTGCSYFEDPRLSADGWSGQPLQGSGEPFERLDEMSPPEVEVVLRELGLCYGFDYSWRVSDRFEDARLNRHLDGGRERRCSAPPTGEVKRLSFAPAAPSVASGATVIVEVVDDAVRDLPEPPPAGTDCPAL